MKFSQTRLSCHCRSSREISLDAVAIYQQRSERPTRSSSTSKQSATHPSTSWSSTATRSMHRSRNSTIPASKARRLAWVKASSPLQAMRPGSLDA